MTISKSPSSIPPSINFPGVDQGLELPRQRWTWIIFGLIFFGSQQGCHSDFHVLLPETCNLPEAFNFTWIRSMVHLGIREEQTHIVLNIVERKEICDGSKGLLKFISIAHADPDGKMIASLEPHLCPTATTFTRSHRKNFVSWTCSQHVALNPGVISLKPQISDVILAIQRMLRYSHWDSVAITKSRFDKSRFCDEVGAYLQQELKERENKSVIILGNYEDLEHHLFSAITNNLDGLFFCISYDYGFTHNLSHKTELKNLGSSSARKIPLVLLPEWPLPVEIFSPPTPTLALVANSYPRTPTTSSFDFQPKNWDPVETITEKISPLKMLETLLAQMILKSIKLSLEMDILSEVEESREQTTTSLFLSSAISPGASGTPPGSNSKSGSVAQGISPIHQLRQQQKQQQNQNQQQQQKNGKSSSFSSLLSSPIGQQPKQGERGRQRMGSLSGNVVLNPEHQFLFSILQFEKARWHPLINLVNGVKHSNPKGGGSGAGHDRPASSDGGKYAKEKAAADFKSEYLVTWFKVTLAILIFGFFALGTGVLIFYYRARSRRGLYKDRKFYSARQCRQLSLRHRGPGPYKILLKASDITYGACPAPENPGKRSSKSPFIGNLSPFQRSSQEKPDLLKGSFGGSSGTLRKQSSVTNLKQESSSVTDGPNFGELTARYKGDVVFLKKLVGVPTTEPFEVKMKAMLLLETLHGLRHENLVAMLGCLTEETPALVWEYCSRGSLYDIIKQKDIKLDWAFKLSLLTDLVRGMRYLHSSMIRCHGFLNSHNCVIDSRWVLKITDYGMPGFYQTQGLSYPAKPPKEMLWTAPELLRDENLRRQGTQPGDVYSFAIIMQEVLVRGEPYCMLTLTPEEILEKLKRPPPLIRPSVSKGSAPPEAVNIMRQCWAELPDMRPDFMVIHDLFKTLNHGRKANIVDTMFQMLEKYSNNLEELIRERTEQLDLEKKKTEQLLNRMLPDTVADKLKLGLPVDPEEFSEVTIYFSDIVGFTTISAYSTPFEVVDLLNDLYTCFDATINDYNVYKVETIGDAYMVVGGAPVLNPDHADQIAMMALDLLHQSGKFRIRHLPFTPLRLRIGLHTGSCCAGVVGLTMPRYCLFGDTVNTASRMESTGAPWRIHISAETKAKLDEAGGYITEYRGNTEIKGKGPMPTYWLLGKEGFDKELPTPPNLSENHGLDENSIKYGRTGIMPGSTPPDTGPRDVVTAVEKKDTNPVPTTNPVLGRSMSTKLLSPKVSSSFGFVSGENMRSLSPAEQVAHQLLNGRPTSKGLRRQLSLDHRAMPVVLRAANKATVRRAPSLEKNMESTGKPPVAPEDIPLKASNAVQSNTTLASSKGILSRSDSNQSSRSSILKHSSSSPITPRVVTFEGEERKSSGSAQISSRAIARKEDEPVININNNNNPSSSITPRTTEPIPSRKVVVNHSESEVINVPDPTSHKLQSTSSNSREAIISSSVHHDQSNSNSLPSPLASSSGGGSSSNSTKIDTNFPSTAQLHHHPYHHHQVQNHHHHSLHNSTTSTTNSTASPIIASAVSSNELVGNNTVVSNNIIITSSDPKHRINANRAAKLAKVLSVVEESPKMERKYEMSSPNQV